MRARHGCWIQTESVRISGKMDDSTIILDATGNIVKMGWSERIGMGGNGGNPRVSVGLLQNASILVGLIGPTESPK
jgi:hypothetical protein